MKFYGLVIGLFFAQGAYAQTITVENIKVSVKADSAAAAREQALEQAHQLAFQKFVDQALPEASIPMPPADMLQDMVNDFSIDREKTTPTSYAASLTFHFEEPQVRAWLQQFQKDQPQIAHFSQADGQSLKIKVSYSSHKDWQQMKKILSECPGVQSFFVASLSPQSANLELLYGGALDQLTLGLHQRGLQLSEQAEGWVASLEGGMNP